MVFLAILFAVCYNEKKLGIRVDKLYALCVIKTNKPS